MNRKQKVLTIIALIAFVLIGVGHYVALDQLPNSFISGRIPWYLAWTGQGHPDPLIEDVRMPWFMLGVIYAGLFFLLADKKEKRP